MIDEFKLCKGCPAKARYWDPDGYWCCKHPEANKYAEESYKDTIESPIPFVCMISCPCGHWVRTANGGQRPKGQSELELSS